MNPVDLPVSESSEYNKVLVTGHSLSGYEIVHTLLENAGMQTAKPSRHEKMQPREISSTLLKANKKRNTSNTIEQVTVSPIWNGLAMDLMMGNLDQEMWCWADPDALPLLEYWNALDTRLAFVLVYDTPNNFLARTFEDSEEISHNALAARLEEWNAYNRALMKFYLRHTECSYLVQASQIRSNSSYYLEDVRKQLGLPLLSDQNSFSYIQDRQDNVAPEKIIYSYLAQELLHQNPESVALYEELQSIANIARDDKYADSTMLENAWTAVVRLKKHAEQQRQSSENTLQHLRSTNDQLQTELEGLHSHQDHLNTQIRQLQETLEQQAVQSQSNTSAYEQERAHMARTAEAQASLLEEKTAALLSETEEKKALLEENDLLLTQLRLAQDDMERHALESQNLQRERQQLSQQATLLKKDNAKIDSLVKERDRLSENSDRLLDELQQAKKELLGALATFKQEKHQLSQKVSGQASMLDESEATKSSLIKERDELLDELQHVKKELQGALTTLEQDKHQLSKKVSGQASMLEEAKVTNDSLNLQLKTAEENIKIVEEENEILLTQLHALQGELEWYHLETQTPTTDEMNELRPYGAAERIKNQLSYRLGATMIDRSHSFSGWITMPTALLRESQKYRSEFAKRDGQKLPPIHSYADAHEADRVKQHLSYRLGQAMIKNARSPIGWVKLPWALRRARVEYKKNRTNKKQKSGRKNQ